MLGTGYVRHWTEAVTPTASFQELMNSAQQAAAQRHTTREFMVYTAGVKSVIGGMNSARGSGHRRQ